MNKYLAILLLLSIWLLSACHEVMGQESLSGKWVLCFKKSKFHEGPPTKANRMVLHLNMDQRFTRRFCETIIMFRFNYNGENAGAKTKDEDNTIFKEVKAKESGIYKTEANQLILITGSEEDTLQYKLEDGLLTLIKKPNYSEDEPEILIFRRRQLLF